MKPWIRVAGVICLAASLSSCGDLVNTVNNTIRAIRLAMALQAGDTHRYQHTLEQNITLPFALPGMTPGTVTVPGTFSGVPGLQALQNLASPVSLKLQTTLNYNFRVQLIDSDGMANMQMTYEGLSLNGSQSGGGVDNKIFTLNDSPLKALEGQTISFKMSPLGLVQAVTSNKDLAQILFEQAIGLIIKQSGANTPENKNIFEKIFGTAGQADMLEQLFQVYPQNSVEPNDTWDISQNVDFVNFGYLPVEIENTWKLISGSTGDRQLSMNGKMTNRPNENLSFGVGPIQLKFDSQGQQSGNLSLDAVTGLPLRSETRDQYTLTPQLPAIPDFLKPFAPALPSGVIRMDSTVKFEKLPN